MPDRDQRHSRRASFEAMRSHGVGAVGFRLRLTRELSDGFVTLRRDTAAKLLLSSPVINQR